MLQVHVDITKAIKTPGSRVQLEAARGELTPFLRDSLVGLNYAYYEPPGAQILHNNPLFVRSHDFSGETIMGVTQLWQAPELFNQGSPAGGGAYLVGSLAELPYVLATTEEDFIAPKNVQALIWKEVTADLLVSATLPRWWSVTRNELHAVALYQRSGEDLVTASVANEELRGQSDRYSRGTCVGAAAGRTGAGPAGGRRGSGSCSRNPGRHLSSCRGVSRQTSPRRLRLWERPGANWIRSTGNTRPR